MFTALVNKKQVIKWNHYKLSFWVVILGLNWKDCHHHLLFYLLFYLLIYQDCCFHLVGCYYLFQIILGITFQCLHSPVYRTISLLLILRFCRMPNKFELPTLWKSPMLIIFRLLVFILVWPWLSLGEDFDDVVDQCLEDLLLLLLHYRP